MQSWHDGRFGCCDEVRTTRLANLCPASKLALFRDLNIPNTRTRSELDAQDLERLQPNHAEESYPEAALSRNHITRPLTGRTLPAGYSLGRESGSARNAASIGRLSSPATRK